MFGDRLSPLFLMADPVDPFPYRRNVLHLGSRASRPAHLIQAEGT